MINKRLLTHLWKDENLSDQSLRLVLDKIYERINENDDGKDELGLCKTLESAFCDIFNDVTMKNMNSAIWRNLKIIFDEKYMNDDCQWIDFSNCLDAMISNNEMVKYLMNHNLLNVDHCFKNTYKLKKALLNKKDSEWKILRDILQYLMKHGKKYKEELKLICIENQKIAMNIQNKPRCLEQFRMFLPKKI